MPYLFLASADLLRFEDDATTIATLLRKGWQQIADPEVPGSEWNGTEWVAPPPEAPVPRWVQFGVALGVDPAVNELVGTVAQVAPVLHLMLGVGLGQAAQGDPKTFMAAWTQAKGAGLVSSGLASAVAEMAESFDLPSDFVASLAA